MGLFVEDGGLLTSVQDEGRFGYQQYGVSPSGPMDVRSFHIANLLVGNPRGESALEITFIGPRLRFTKANTIAITGGDFRPRINGSDIANYEAIRVREGDVLSFGGLKSGSRGYIAFFGGLDIPLVMGSRSTLLRNGIGGLQGRRLQKGDEIAFLNPSLHPAGRKKRSIPPERFPQKEIVLRVVVGPQENEFTDSGLKRFFWFEKIISNEFDRMGCRLECDPVEHKGDGNIITDGISFGSIQVPTSGQPIIMLADRQSTGGYAKIGTVISVDLPLIAQGRPGDRVRFVRVSLKLAQSLYLRELEKMNWLEDYLKEEE